MTLERLYEKNELEEAKRYSTELKMVLAKAAGTIKSGNPVTDVILQDLLLPYLHTYIRMPSKYTRH